MAEKKLDIAYWLDIFHTYMSFIGSIGYVMGRSGSVLHMLSGKAYTRAVRGCILVD